MQFSERIGRIWRLKLIGSAAQAALSELPDYCTGFVARGIDEIAR